MTKSIKLSAILLISLVFVGCTAAAPSDPGESELKTFTLDEVAQHSERTDCWLVVEGNVYDVTAFIAAHPGGAEILAGCGKDATDLFLGDDPSGREHSAAAKARLNQHLIGVVE